MCLSLGQAFLNRFNGEVPSDIIKYWLEVLQYTDSVGTKEFKDLVDYALACLFAPVSTATVK